MYQNDIGDEYHYLFCCCYYFESERKRILKPSTFYRNHDMLKFINLLSSDNVNTPKRPSEFTLIIMDKVISKNLKFYVCIQHIVCLISCIVQLGMFYMTYLF